MGSGEDARRAVLGPAAAGVIAPTDALDPLELGPYQIVGSIGRGGMGEIYLARRRDQAPKNGRVRLYALKVLVADDDAEDDLVRMFVDEASIMAEIHHPNVLEVFQFGREGERYYLAMEYLAGRPLVRVMIDAYAREQGLDVRVAATIAGQAARGLDAAHSAIGKNGQPLQVVHRDVSPQNLFITWPGHTKVIDFGVARAAERVAHTTAGQLKGKAAYMSPEQVKGQIVDRRSDVFSLGICLWEMCAGRRLFKRENEWDTMNAVVSGPLVPPSQVRGVGDPELDRIVLRALERDPDKRFATAAELAHRLEGFVVTQRGPDPLRGVAELMARLYGAEAREEAALIDDLGGRVARQSELDSLRRLSGISLKPSGLRDITVVGAPELMRELDHFGERSSDPGVASSAGLPSLAGLSQSGLVIDSSEPKTNMTTGPDAVRRAVARVREERGYAGGVEPRGWLGVDRRAWIFGAIGLVGTSALLTVLSVVFFRGPQPAPDPIPPLPEARAPAAAPSPTPAAAREAAIEVEPTALELEPIDVAVPEVAIVDTAAQAVTKLEAAGVRAVFEDGQLALESRGVRARIAADARVEVVEQPAWRGLLLVGRRPGTPSVVAVGAGGARIAGAADAPWSVAPLSITDCPATARAQAAGVELTYGRRRFVLPYPSAAGVAGLGRLSLERPRDADRAELAELGVAFGAPRAGSSLVLCGRGLDAERLALEQVPVGRHRVTWQGPTGERAVDVDVEPTR